MKILMINSVCGIKSTGRICTDLAGVLTAQGHEVKIAYGREAVPEKYRDIAVRIGGDLDVKLHGVKARLLDGAGFGSRRATENFIRWVKEYDPDIIHLHNIHGYYINIEILFDYIKREKKPVIWTLHDCWTFTGHCAHFDYANCNKWQTRCFSCPQSGGYPKSLCDHSERNYEKKKDIFSGVKNMTIVTPSKWLADLVRQSFLRNYPVLTINNGIDLNIFKPTQGDVRKKYDLDGKTVALGVASTWSERKGLNDFIRLSQMLDDHYRIVLVGLSEKQKEALPKRITGITRTNNTRELAEIYTAADVFVNPTYEDNYPTTNLEAQACGTPVITYETGGSPEALTADCGVCVPKGELDGLKNAIEAVCGKEKSCVCSRSSFDRNIRYGEYMKLYHNMQEGNVIKNADFEK